MKEETFKIEIITPTIMGGADSKELDSLKIRPSEIKAMMRYVFRAIAGKFVDHKNIEQLLKVEGEIFGDTSKKSDFKIILSDTENLKDEYIKLLPHKSNFQKKAVIPNQFFNLTIIANKYDLEFYKSLLNLAFLIGIGNRRNRLNGNLQINYDLNFASDIQTVSNLCKTLLNTEEIKTNNPQFPSFTLREDGNKNYFVYSMRLKKNYSDNLQKNKFENLLIPLYKEVIHEIEKGPYKDLLGSATPRQASFVNFSIQKVGKDSYKLFLICFYYKNKNFEYETWKEGIEKIRELTEKTFKEQSNETVSN
ncbi:type III-B CRISPR module RAMP protein Cmr1 [Sulfurihydrogenibium sp.]|uniref:type III-B CRISPR module RAMP protein Cmr1 n=1 Tax=Sulfurihydrogenibium sp. TaxID=2053621 RepID=UPI003D14AA12